MHTPGDILAVREKRTLSFSPRDVKVKTLVVVTNPPPSPSPRVYV